MSVFLTKVVPVVLLEVALVEHPKLAFSKKSIDFHQCPVLPVIPKSENTHVYHL